MLKIRAKIRLLLESLIAASLLSTASFAAVEERWVEPQSVGLTTQSYLSTLPGIVSTLNPTMDVRLGGYTRGEILDAGAQGEFMLTLPPAALVPYFEVSKAFVGTSPELSPVQLRLGRRLEDWNQLDERWRLGIWQPRFRWDYLRPEMVGLTGAFLSYENEFLKVVAFGSGLYVPERGVQQGVEDGAIVAQSPWFIPPPKRISILQRNTPVQYELQIPPIKDIVIKPSTSLLLRVGEQQGFWGSMGYAYKPMNQLLMGYFGYLQIRSQGQDVAKAVIYPRVDYHHLVSGELGYVGEQFNTWISVLDDRPVRGATPAEWTTQEVARSLAVAYTLDVALGSGPLSRTRAEFSYLRQWGGNLSDRDPSGASAGSAFDSRYPYQNALSVGVKSQLPSLLGGWTQHFLASTSALFDIGHRGTIWSTEFKYRALESVVMSLGVDLLGSDQGEANSARDFIGRYRANDRVQAGVSYVF